MQIQPHIYPIMYSIILVPKMHHVMRVVVPKIAGHWKEVAFNLHYDVTRVRIIQEKCRDDPERCTCELFIYWLQSSEGLGPRSWETLLSVLKETPKLTAVKESIERELIELLTYVILNSILFMFMCNIVGLMIRISGWNNQLHFNCILYGVEGLL